MELSPQRFISPTHKRTEGRAPVWASEFITKSTPRGDSAEFSPSLNVNSGSRLPACLRGAFISPTHKRTEGRASVWGSEFTSKRRRTTGGGPAETAARLNVKLWTSVTGGGGILLLFITQSFFESI